MWTRPRGDTPAPGGDLREGPLGPGELWGMCRGDAGTPCAEAGGKASRQEVSSLVWNILPLPTPAARG